MRNNAIVKVFNIANGAEEISRAVDLKNERLRDWLVRTVFWASANGKLVQIYNINDEGRVNANAS